MKLLLWMGTLAMALYAGDAVQLAEQYRDSTKCKACHHHIIGQWENSWHSKSHYKNDEYFRKTVDYLSRKSRRSQNSIEVACAACHNPRIAVTETDINYEILVAMKLDENSAVNKALESDTIAEGINCVVCHNIDKIHTEYGPDQRGVHRVEWMAPGTMVGPLGDAFSPYHKTEKREFFDTQANTLCFVCHANDRSEEGVVFTNMEQELQKSDKMCVDCHMSPRHDGIASTLRIDNGKQKERKVRDHGFRGAHTVGMWEGALELDAKKDGNALLVTMTNRNPHNLPSGFGARELIIDIEYKSVGKVIQRQSMSLTRRYTSKRDKPTIPHLAKEQSADMSIPAHGERSVKFPLVKGADGVNITLSYRLVNDEVRSLLELEEPIWSEKMLINTLRMKL